MNAFSIRPFTEADRTAAEALGGPIVAGWHGHLPTLHLVTVSSERIVGHLQVASRNARCETILRIAHDHWQDGLPEALLQRALLFARDQGATRLTAAYLETEEKLASFLLANGFTPFERYLPSRLALEQFDPSGFDQTLRRVEDQGIRLLTYTEAGDTPANRRALFDLECAAKSVQPFREAKATLPTFEDWERELRPNGVFLAKADNRFVGLITSLEWGFTGVHPDWQGRGIATALKVWSLTVAKERGIEAIDTENHEDNAPMLAINRRLGFVPGPVETNCRLIL